MIAVLDNLHLPVARAPLAMTCVILLALLADKSLLRMTPVETEGYHANVRAVVTTLPNVTGSWLGRDVAVPEGAVRMLHPNIVLSRQYVNIQTNESFSLLLVHTRDARDIIGHYPPVCYPGQGWEINSSRPTNWAGLDRPVRGIAYDFSRNRSGSRLSVDNFLITAGGEISQDMRGIERAAGDRHRKFYGAAQVQFVSDGTLDPERRHEIVEEFIQFLEPVLQAISERNTHAQH